MVVPESSHDRSCSKESPKNVPSAITIPESGLVEIIMKPAAHQIIEQSRSDITRSSIYSFSRGCVVLVSGSGHDGMMGPLHSRGPSVTVQIMEPSAFIRNGKGAMVLRYAPCNLHFY